MSNYFDHLCIVFCIAWYYISTGHFLLQFGLVYILSQEKCPCPIFCGITKNNLECVVQTLSALFEEVMIVHRNYSSCHPPIWILMKQEMMGWHWHQLDHTQIICTSVQTDGHTSNSSLNFLQAGCSSGHLSNSVKALKAIWRHWRQYIESIVHNNCCVGRQRVTDSAGRSERKERAAAGSVSFYALTVCLYTAMIVQLHCIHFDPKNVLAS